MLYLCSAAALALSITATQSGDWEFVETFDGDPNGPAALDSARWAISVHSRDSDTFAALEPMAAQHGPQCQPPPAQHTVSAYEDTVFRCKNHLMTAINATGYGVVYLTPNALVDISAGEAVVQVDVSTLRTSGRDWWDIYLTPWEDQLALPLEEWLPDLQGQPRNAVHVRLDFGPTGRFKVSVWEDWQETEYETYWLGYEQVLTPDPKQRETFELRIARDHLAFGLPEYDFWFLETPIPELPFTSGVLQLGHHSYNPTKDDGPAPPEHDTSLAGLAWGDPNTWHWDDVRISEARPFTLIGADRRAVSSTDANPTVTLDAPAPADAFLRFSGLGTIAVAFDGGASEPAQRRDGSKQTAGNHDAWHFSSYWTPIPAGTQQVTFTLGDEGSWTFEKLVRDISVWSLDSSGVGCAGSGGAVPELTVGQPTLGNAAFALDVGLAAPGAPTIFALARQSATLEPPTAVNGCGILVELGALLSPGPVSAGVVAAGALGDATLALPIPAQPALLGLDLGAQAFPLDAGGALPFGGLAFAATALQRFSIQ